MLTPVPVTTKQKSIDICRLFCAGAPRDAEGFVFYGVTESNYDGYRRVLKSGAPYYFIDNSYFDCVRGVQYRVTKNSVQVARARDMESNGTRFAKLGLEIKPWQNNPDGRVIAIEQSPVFMKYTAKSEGWLTNALRLFKGKKVKLRRWNGNKPVTQKTLVDDLAGAHALVTHSSAAAVGAALAGISPFVSPMSAMFNMGANERQRFMNVLADNQWTLNEIKEGAAWAWLNK